MKMDRQKQILELIREGARPRIAPTQQRIVVHGNGNVLGDQITIRSGERLRYSPAAKKTVRSSAISYIYSTCRALGHPLLYQDFARAEFGNDDLDSLEIHELERIRGWIAARRSQFHGE